MEKLKIIFELKFGPDVNAQPEKSNEKVNGDIYISYNSHPKKEPQSLKI